MEVRLPGVSEHLILPWTILNGTAEPIAVEDGERQNLISVIGNMSVRSRIIFLTERKRGNSDGIDWN
jgi:hypothetical protein